MTNLDLSLRHLADVQSVINRLSQNSFVIRGWSVTLVSAVFAALASQGRGGPTLLLAALTPAVIFWWLDASYLRKERLFRELYADIARALSDGVTGQMQPFDMDVSPYVDRIPSYARTLFAGGVLAIPLILLIVITLYIFVV